MQEWICPVAAPVVLLIGQLLGKLINTAAGSENKEVTAAFATVHAGLLLAAACFDLISCALEWARPGIVAAAVGIGALFMFSAALYQTKQQLPVLIWQMCMGLVFGAGCALSADMGRKLFATFFLCAFLQGAAYGGRAKEIFMWFLCALLGCLVGQTAGNSLPELGGICLALSGGALLFSSCRTLLPGKKKRKHAGAGSTVLGLVLGLVLSLL